MLGSELTNGLANLNYNIYANDINFTYKIAKVKNIKLLKSDFLKPKKLDKLHNIDIFIHSAAITKSSRIIDKKNLITTNLKLTKIALTLAKKFKTKKFFLISSSSVYRNYEALIYNERSKILGKDAYSKSKIMSEKLCRLFCTKNNIKFTILRIGNIYNGFEMSKWSRKNVSIIQQWLNSFKKNRSLKTNSFNVRRDWTFIEDIPKAIHDIIKNDNNFKILNLVSPYICKDIDIMKKITKDKSLFQSEYKEAKHNATSSIYMKKINFNNWTSPQRGINLIKKSYEEN